MAPLYYDITLVSKASFNEAIPEGHNAFIMVFDGLLTVEDEVANSGTINVLSSGDSISITAGTDGARFLPRPLLIFQSFSERVNKHTHLLR
jgi:quercetin 2,3-dioxygenase